MLLSGSEMLLKDFDNLSVTALDPPDSTFVDRLDKYSARSMVVADGEIHNIYEDYSDEKSQG